MKIKERLSKVASFLVAHQRELKIVLGIIPLMLGWGGADWAMLLQ